MSAREVKEASSAQSIEESVSEHLDIPEGGRVAEKTTRRGRVVKLPQKL